MSVNRMKIESDSIATTVVSPTWSGNIEQSKEDDAIYFRDKLSGDLTFTASDYQLIYGLPECERVDVFLEEKCQGDWVEAWRGKFTRYDAKFNENKCLAEIRPAIVDNYECLLKDIDTEYVFAELDQYQVKSIQGNYQAGQLCCHVLIPAAVDIPTESVCAIPATYCFDKNTSEIIGALGLLRRVVSCFHRVKAEGTATDPPTHGTGWEYLGEQLGRHYWWRCPVPGEARLGTLGHGRLFREVIEFVLSQGGCVSAIRSHFFNINATHTAPPDNIAYDFSTANLQDVFVFQKSDVKRPDATNEAADFVLKMSAKKLLDDLRTMFNVYFVINSDNEMILEHITYFEALAGLDVSGVNINIEYGKGETSAPNIENFRWADDASFSEAHKGYQISYGECGSGTKEHQVNLFSNDIFYIRETENQAEISDTGFCLVTTLLEDGQYYVKENNDPLGWVALHENLHKHYRYFADGIMNDVPETFLSVRRTRKLKPFSVNVCCDDGFSPEQYITTAAGRLDIDKCTINYFAGANNRRITIEGAI